MTEPDRIRAAGSDQQESLGQRLGSSVPDQRERAWRQLYDQQFDRVYRLFCRFGVMPGEVEELTQQVFMIAFRRIRAGTEVSSPGTWLKAIAVKVVSDHRRWRRVREAKRWLLRDVRVAAPPPMLSPEHAATASERLERTRQILSALSRAHQDVLVLCDLEQCTPSQTAEMLGIPVNTVRSRRRSAKIKFLALWRRRFGDER